MRSTRHRFIPAATLFLFAAALVTFKLHREEELLGDEPSKPPAPSVAAPTSAASNVGTADTIQPKSCADFLEWARRYVAAPSAEQATLVAAGETLARPRLVALADLIQSDPESALANELPYTLRRAMPDSIQALLEERVSRRADFEVMGLVPLPGDAAQTPPIIRAVVRGEERDQVFAFGEGAMFYTRTNFPVSGIAVSAEFATTKPKNPVFQPVKLMALRPNPARLVERAEVDDVLVKLAAEPICSVSGKPVLAGGNPAGVELAGRLNLFDEPAHAQDFADATPAREHIHGIAAAGDDASTADAPPIAYAYNSIGTKRYLFMRVKFTDGSYTISTNSAVTLLNNLSNFFATMSYGKLLVAPLTGSPSSGSAITPELQLNQPASYYDNAGLSKLYPDALAAASAAGYNTANYQFACVFTSSKPAAGYAGVAYVGARGSHMANGYFSEKVTAHELGHNKGLYHAHTWDTGDASIIGDGTSVEYGHPYDVMGSGGYSSGHYAAGHKRVLGWITDAMAPLAPAGKTTYRLYVHDNQSVNNLVTALRASRSGKDYYVEYRQRITGDNTRNGVLLHWCDDGGNNATLLDTRPGQGGEAIYIGRTFSDAGANVHITPVARGNVTPDWMDVVINTGSTSGNSRPVALVSADRTQAATAQSVNFTATATDANGDALAYFWEFGDGNYSTANDPEVSHSFSSAGEYAVQCTVSDMRGGTARDTVIVRVGSPSVFRISGRVLDQNQQPVSGIKITAGSKSASTDSDGTYSVVGLAAGSYTVSAAELVSANTSFLKPFFSNPVTVGPSFTTADFITGIDPPDVYTTLISTNATWRYLDDGSDQGTAWRSNNFNHTAWPSGAGILGYGQSNETTVLNFGPDPTHKFITYYFRRTFTVSNPTNYASYRLQVLRDDGFVAYLNGAEVWRDNMPTGAITSVTLALDQTEPDSYQSRTLAPSQFIAGANTLAVEVHQVVGSSSDMNFDLALSGLSPSSATGQKLVYLTAPSDWTFRPGPTNVALAATALAEGATVTRVDFFRGNTKLGEDTATPFTFTWTNAPVGTNSVKAVAVFNTGISATSAPVTVVITPQPISLALINTGAVWRYFATSAAPAGAWKTPGYDDFAWPAGPAELGYGDGDEATTLPFGGVSTNKWITSYYRRAFHVTDPYSVTNLALELKRDDGAVVYLNGVEIVRDGMASGTVNYSTYATNAVNGADENVFVPFTASPALLVPGTNIIAVEIHQSTNTSSDISFDLNLDGLASTNRPRGVWLTSPAPASSYTLPVIVPLAVQVTVASNVGVSKVEFYSGTTKIGENTVFPYAFNWNASGAGTFALKAVAIDTAGGSVTSAPVSITLRAPSPEVALVNFGGVWRYLDTGISPATNWTSVTNFNDSAWLLGAAKLGYGGDGEATVVGYGPDSSAKFTTTWFRHSFNIANPAAFASLKLRVIRDDGVAVYLNGTEVFRDNLPPGVLASNTLALTAIGSTNEITPVEGVITNLLRAGENILAVEVHQSTLNSSDLGLDVALTGLSTTNLTQGVFLTSPAAGERFIEGAPIALEAFATSAAGVTLAEYFANGVKIAQGTTLPYAAMWTNAAAGTHVLTARAALGNGTMLTSPPVTITVSAPAFAATLLAPTGLWRYHDEGLDLGTAWRDDGFDDATWDVGPAKFGFGDADIVTTLATNRADGSRIVTYYFRQNFSLPADVVVTNLALRVQRDDAAIVYLNGVEVWRDTNMPAGLITFTNLALVAVGGVSETLWLAAALNPAALRPGQNLITAEVHQNATNSSDLGFALDLSALGYFDYSPPIAPILSITHEPDLGRITLSWPDTGAFTLHATPSLAAPVTWAPLVGTPVLKAGIWSLSIPTPASPQFFRLRSP
jgi:PKD domain/Bacterial Ig domain/Carboxypeptidase regulatory-like domain